METSNVDTHRRIYQRRQFIFYPPSENPDGVAYQIKQRMEILIKIIRIKSTNICINLMNDDEILNYNTTAAKVDWLKAVGRGNFFLFAISIWFSWISWRKSEAVVDLETFTV